MCDIGFKATVYLYGFAVRIISNEISGVSFKLLSHLYMDRAFYHKMAAGKGAYVNFAHFPTAPRILRSLKYIFIKTFFTLSS